MGLPRIAIPAASIALAGALAASGCVRPETPPAPGPAAALAACQAPRPFPAGFNYPQSATTVEQWVRSGDVRRAQEHGWWLWAGLNDDDGRGPVWRSWCTSTQAFDTGRTPPPAEATAPQAPLNAIRAAHGLTTSEDPINLPGSPGYPIPDAVRAKYGQCVKPGVRGQLDSLRDGPNYQNNGDVMVAGVIYDPQAFDAIRKRRLYLGATLDGQLPRPGQTKAIDDLPHGSIVLKPMMWPVRANGFTALPLWDGPPAVDDGRYAGFEIQSKWPQAVAVGAGPVAPGTRADVTYLHGVYSSAMLGRRPLPPVTYRQARAVSTSQFYSFRPDLAGMHPCDRAILDASAYYAWGGEFSPGDQLVVIAMHIMTREQPAWTFQSVWWDDRPTNSTAAAYRPDIPRDRAPGPWRNYLIASTYGIPDGNDPTRWPVAFNPYIELAADHPVRTNCMNCHHRAAWPAAQASYEAPGGPDALQRFDGTNPIFRNLLTVDALWSITDRAAGSSAGAKAQPAAPRR